MLATIAVPIVLTLLFSSISGGEETRILYVMDFDQSVYSEKLLKLIETGSSIKTISSSKEQIDESMKEQNSITVLIVERGFGSNLISNSGLSLKLMQNYESGENILMEQKILSKVAVFKNIIRDCDFASTEFNNLKVSNSKEGMFEEVFNDIFNAWEKPSKRLIKFETTSKKQNSIDSATEYSVGFLIFFLCFVVIQGIRTFIEEKENRTFFRLLSTPISYNKIMIGKVVSIFVYGAVQIVVLFIIGKLFFKVAWFNSLFSILVILGLYLFTIICMGLLFIPFVKDQRQLNTVSSLIIVVTSMMGGTFFPIDIGPELVKTIAQVTPQRWAIKSLLDIVANGSSLGAQSGTILVLGSMGLVSLLISLVLINRQLKIERGV